MATYPFKQVKHITVNATQLIEGDQLLDFDGGPTHQVLEVLCSPATQGRVVVGLFAHGPQARVTRTFNPNTPLNVARVQQ